jgi:hypothetical protein
VIIEKAIAAKELPQHTSPDLLLDALYGGLYYWLLFDPCKLTTATSTHSSSWYSTMPPRMEEAEPSSKSCGRALRFSPEKRFSVY